MVETIGLERWLRQVAGRSSMAGDVNSEEENISSLRKQCCHGVKSRDQTRSPTTFLRHTGLADSLVRQEGEYCLVQNCRRP